MNNSFEYILKPFEIKKFSENYYSKKTLIIKGENGKFNDIFNWNSLNNIFNTSIFQDNQVYVVKNNSEEYFNSNNLQPAKILSMCKEGYTLVIKNITFYDSNLLNLLYNISNQTKLLSRMTLEASFSNKQIKNLSKNNSELFVINISGKSKWKIYNPSKIEDIKEPCFEIELEKNDVLYIPSQHYFTAYTEESSLIIYIEVLNDMGVNFISWMTKNLDINTENFIPLQKKDNNISDSWNNYHQKLKEII